LLGLLADLESEKKFDAIFIRGLRSIKRTWWLNRDDTVQSLHLPYQIKEHNNFLMKEYCLRTNRCLFQDKIYFAVSEHITAPVVNMLTENNIKPKNFEAIHNPCDIERVQHLSEEKVDVFPGKYILGVGRLTRQKRFDLLIKAYHEANVQDHKLVILGEGNQRCELEKLISELGLVGSVIMPGFVCNPYPWYKSATLFVLSSDCEGFGNVIVEALACGVPVISTDCGPVHEILTGELSQGLTPTGDYLALSEKINQYLISPVLPKEENVNRFSFETIISRQLALVELKN
ncbi:MAG: glycosyltransferase, partial [Psychromonas sp.]